MSYSTSLGINEENWLKRPDTGNRKKLKSRRNVSAIVAILLGLLILSLALGGASASKAPATRSPYAHQQP